MNRRMENNRTVMVELMRLQSEVERERVLRHAAIVSLMTKIAASLPTRNWVWQCSAHAQCDLAVQPRCAGSMNFPVELELHSDPQTSKASQ